MKPSTSARVPDAPGLEMRLSVPSEGTLSKVAGELAAKVAEFLGDEGGDEGTSIGATLEQLASRVAAAGEDITFEFRQIDRELVIQARCNGRSSEARYALPT
jgi:hypothetical protein